MNLWLNKFVFGLFILGLSSCHIGKNFSKMKTNGEVALIPSSLLPLSDTIYKYRTVVNTYGKTISGILLLKPQDVDTLKATFVSTAGLKLFDMCILKDTFIVVYATPMLERFETLKTLATSINIASFWSASKYTNPRKGRYKNQDWNLYNYSGDYIVTTADGLILKYLYSKKLKEKFTVKYVLDNECPPTKIDIDYTRFDLTISLEKIID